MMIGRGIRIFQEQWPHHRQPSSRSLFSKGVEIGHEPVTLLNKAAANRLLRGLSHPGLLIAGSLLRVVAINGLKCRNLKPLGQQIRRRCSGITAYVRTAESEP